MFDEETKSLWSTLEGKPVVGPLAGSGIELVPLPVVTTTWREWRTRHPQTTVLSEDTGHDRDYSEGAAYRTYFATDELMFQVPQPDTRLRNKAEVLVMLLTNRNGGSHPVAIAADFLSGPPDVSAAVRRALDCGRHVTRWRQSGVPCRRRPLRATRRRRDAARQRGPRLASGRRGTGLEGTRSPVAPAPRCSASVLVRLARAVPKDRTRPVATIRGDLSSPIVICR